MKPELRILGREPRFLDHAQFASTNVRFGSGPVMMGPGLNRTRALSPHGPTKHTAFSNRVGLSSGGRHRNWSWRNTGKPQPETDGYRPYLQIAGEPPHNYRRPEARSEERRVGKECRSRWSP